MPTKNSREFHLDNLPRPKFYIFLKEKFRKQILNDTNKISQITGRTKSTLERWRSGKCDRGRAMGKWRRGEQFIPLVALLKICKGVGVSTETLEKNIIAYKAPGAGSKIRNPVLPLKEKHELIGLLTHIVCDGSGLPDNTNYYRNFNTSLLDEFERNLKTCFGDVEITRKENLIIFPKIITYTLSYIYKINFGTFNARLPKDLWNLPKRFAAVSIRAFADDEASIGHSGIRFYSANKNLLNDLKSLIEYHFPEIRLSPIFVRQRKNTIEYSFAINPLSFNEFHRKIGFTHSDKKADLEFYIKKGNKNWDHRPKGKTKEMILRELLKKEKSTKELAKKLFITPKLITYHLSGYDKRGKRIKGLEELGYVSRIRRGKEILWKSKKEVSRGRKTNSKSTTEKN